jgi:NAD(P)-dependent dehydrogenase (short-subunit alcohol dehydrogenase family)
MSGFGRVYWRARSVTQAIHQQCDHSSRIDGLGEAAAQEVGPDARAIQLDVTDQASIAGAAERVRNELGRLDVLVTNAAISNTRMRPDMSVAEYAKSTRPSVVSLREMRAVFETNVFGVVAVTQAMLSLLREAPTDRIVNVSSGVGSLTRNADPDFPWRLIFGPVYPTSKTALNAITLAMVIELESTGITVHAACPGFTKTNLNNYAAHRPSRRTPASRCVSRSLDQTARQARSRTQPGHSRGDVGRRAPKTVRVRENRNHQVAITTEATVLMGLWPCRPRTRRP